MDWLNYLVALHERLQVGKLSGSAESDRSFSEGILCGEAGLAAVPGDPVGAFVAAGTPPERSPPRGEPGDHG
jgi:hypothetical protein